MVGLFTLEWTSRFIVIACILIFAESSFEPSQLVTDTSTGFDDIEIGNGALSLLQMHAARTGRSAHSAAALPPKSEHIANVSNAADADTSKHLADRLPSILTVKPPHEAGQVQTIVTGEPPQKAGHVAQSAAHSAMVVANEPPNGTHADSIPVQPERLNHVEKTPAAETGRRPAANISFAATSTKKHVPLEGTSLLNRSGGTSWRAMLRPFVVNIHARVTASSGGGASITTVGIFLVLAAVIIGCVWISTSDSARVQPGTRLRRTLMGQGSKNGRPATESVLQARSMDPVTNSAPTMSPRKSAGPSPQSPTPSFRPYVQPQAPSQGPPATAPLLKPPRMGTPTNTPPATPQTTVPTLPSLGAIQQTFNGIPACIQMLPPPIVKALVMDNCESFFLVPIAELRQALVGGAAGVSSNILGLSGRAVLRAMMQVAGGEQTLSLMMNNARSPPLGTVVRTAQGAVALLSGVFPNQKHHATLVQQSPTEVGIQLASKSAGINMLMLRFDALGQRIEILGDDEPLAWAVLAFGNEFLGNVENLELRVRPGMDSLLLLLSVLGAVLLLPGLGSMNSQGSRHMM